jgi:hypothetical protein
MAVRCFSRRASWGCAVAAAALLALLALTPSAFAAGDANMTSCPNESLPGFEQYLPDCRAYELVTPPFKGGVRIEGATVSADGTHAILSSAGGGFAGTENNVLVPLYELSRTASGWVTSPIDPPASIFTENNNSQLFSSDLSKSVWVLRHPSQSTRTSDLYLREPDGSFVKIGPMVPPAGAAGPPAGSTDVFSGFLDLEAGSDDLSHVVFSAFVGGETFSWPGDSTVALRSTLYEYVGTGNAHPDLVGVSDGHTVVRGKALPAGQLISDCGTELGSLEGDRYNAISADGETVFFTVEHTQQRIEEKEFCRLNTEHGQHIEEGTGPEVNELYARVGGIETVSISEPSASQCQQCFVPSTNALGRRPGVFEGASRDGSKVFFGTSQELLAGATTENLYEYDFDNPIEKKVVRVSIGSPTPEVVNVARVSEDGSHVYFVAKGRLTHEPREGKNGRCIAELSSSERAEEEQAEVEEAEKEGRAEAGAKCRPKEGETNLYVFQRDIEHPTGRIAFVATLVGVNEEGEDDTTDWSAHDRRPVQATPDGRFLVFQSVGDLTSGDTGDQSKIFEYDAETEELVRVSRGQVGYAPGEANAQTRPATISSAPFGTTAFGGTNATQGLAVSTDGSEVLFGSTAALAPQAEVAAAAESNSVYLYRSNGAISNGNVYLISDGKDVGVFFREPGAILEGLDPSGADAFFLSGDHLVSGDSDLQFDLYDARVGGGFPTRAAEATCVGEACQGTPPAAPQFSLSGSILTPGAAPPSSSPPSLPGPASKPIAKSLTPAQKLARALKACKRKRGKKRKLCEATARKTYRGKSAANAKGNG